MLPSPVCHSNRNTRYQWVAPRRYPEITDSSVLPIARVSALSRLVLRRWRRRVFSGAGAGGASRDVTNSETQFVIIKPPFVRPAALLTDLVVCYSLILG